MEVTITNSDYLRIVGDIIDDGNFVKLKEIEHHGITRFEHSVKVSYYSYKISKFMKLDYVATARGGLLHDFFYSKNPNKHHSTLTETITHPRIARENARELFMTNIKEDDIIVSHMFPFYIKFPKYAESWIVNLTDKVVGTTEFVQKFDYKLSYALNLSLLLFINYLIK